MTMDLGNGLNSSSSSSVGLREQLSTVLSVYRLLANLHFLLIEQRASTSSSVRSTVTLQVAQLSAQAQKGFKTLSANHQAKLRQSTILRECEGRSSISSSSSSSSSSNYTGEQVLTGLTIVDQVLAELLTRARRHARNQRRIEALVQDVRANDNVLKSSIKKLGVLRDRCDRLVKMGQEEVHLMDRAEKHPIPYEEILAYASKISQTTTAPPGFKLQLDDEDTAGAGVTTAGDGQMNEDGHDDGDNNNTTNNNANAKSTGRSIYEKEADNNQSKAGRIPAHLLDKLPFPSENAMRRSAMNIPLLTWEDFQRGFLQQVGGEEEEGPAQESAAQNQRVMAAAQMTRPRAQQAEEEEDGFGLDLS